MTQMNRREVLAKLAAAGAVAGVAGETKAVSTEPKLACLVFKVAGTLSMDARKCLKHAIYDAFDGKPPAPVLLLDRGLDLVPIYTEPPANAVEDRS